MNTSIFSDINAAYHADFNYPKVDALMVRLLWFHFVVVVAWASFIYFFEPASFYPSPFSWSNLTFTQLLSIIELALLCAAIPTMLRVRLTSHYAFRVLVTVALSVFSFIIVFMTGGSIEAHFHIFFVFGLVTLYYDWRLVWVVFSLVVLHRLILNYTHPTWLYVYGRNDLSLLVHTLFIILSVLFATWIAEQGRNSIDQVVKANKLLASKVTE